MGFKKVLDTMADVDKTWLDKYASNYEKRKQEVAAKQTEGEQAQAVFRAGLQEINSKQEEEMASLRASQAADLAADDAHEERRRAFRDSPEGEAQAEASRLAIIHFGNPPPQLGVRAASEEKPQKHTGLFGFGILNL